MQEMNDVMAQQYQLNWSDPRIKPTPVTVVPQSKNTSTSLSLPGFNYADYGLDLNKNLMMLLENFASKGTVPVNPTVGQLWYDDTESSIKVCIRFDDVTGSAIWKHVSVIHSTSADIVEDGAFWYDTSSHSIKCMINGVWKNIGPVISSAQPSNPHEGAMWYNTISKKYSFWNGMAWVEMPSIVGKPIPLNNSLSLNNQNYVEICDVSSSFPSTSPTVEYDETLHKVRVTGKNVTLRIKCGIPIHHDNVLVDIEMRRQNVVNSQFVPTHSLSLQTFNIVDGDISDSTLISDPSMSNQVDYNSTVKFNAVIKPTQSTSFDIVIDIAQLPIYTNGNVDFNKVAQCASIADFIYTIEHVSVTPLHRNISNTNMSLTGNLLSNSSASSANEISPLPNNKGVRVVGKNCKIEYGSVISATSDNAIYGRVLLKNINCTGTFSFGVVVLDASFNPITVNGHSECLFIGKNVSLQIGQNSINTGLLQEENSISGLFIEHKNIPGACWLQPVIYINNTSALDGTCELYEFSLSKVDIDAHVQQLTVHTTPTQNNHVVTKEYVDTNSISVNGGNINGYLGSSMIPLASTHYTNKQYVDGAVSTLDNDLRTLFMSLQQQINNLQTDLNDARMRIIQLENQNVILP